MARTIGKLSPLTVKNAKHRGYIADGGGLYLQIGSSGAKSWVFRFRQEGRLREMGLGSADTFKLADARERATECRQQRALGFDPIDVRVSKKAKPKLEAARAMTFKQCAQAYIKDHTASWKNAKHSAQWASTLETYAYPLIGALSVQAIDISLVRKVLDPIWKTKTETASRVRGRIETILDWATVGGYRSGDNPARWRGHLDKMLPPRAKVQKVQHHAALPYTEIGSFMAALRQQDGNASAALELAILTAARTGEVIAGTWDEMDLDAAVWTIPADRMKAGREHRIPLSKPALALLKRMHKAKTDSKRAGFIFPGGKANRPLSNMALLKLLERMERDDVTVHGFRSTFRDWAAERTSYARDVCEQSLAHALPDKVEAAYMRSDQFAKRKLLMEEWAKFCSRSSETARVVPIRSAK